MKKGFINKLKGVLASAAAVVMTVGMIGGNAIPAMAATKGTVVVTPTANQTLTKKAESDYSAENSSHIIKITTPDGVADDADLTYHIYKVFDANSNGDAVSYTDPNNILTQPILNKDTDEASTAKLQLDGTNVKYYARKSTDNSWAEAKISEYPTLDPTIVEKLGKKVNSFTDIGTVTITGGNESAYVEVADYGYFYISTTTGSLVSITTTNKNAEVRDKNNVPDVVKTEDNFTNAIGGTVKYSVDVHAKKGTTNLVFHDKLSKGLTLDTTRENPLTITYKVGTDGAETTMTTKSSGSTDSAITYSQDYFNATAASGQTVTGKFKEKDNITLSFDGTFTDDTTITIVYYATVNNKAVVNENNNATINYGHDSTYESVPSTVYETTFKFKVEKVTGNAKTPLEGAKFVLSTKSTLGVLSESDVTNHTSDLIKLTDAGVVDPATTGNNYIIAADDGTSKNALTINGLDAEAEGTTYYLYEVTAPNGYNKLTSPIAIKITPTFDTTDRSKVVSYKVEYNNNPNAEGTPFVEAGSVTGISARQEVADVNTPTVTVNNDSGSQLPSTGGIGTTIFYVIGGVVVAGAVILLLARRRKNA